MKTKTTTDARREAEIDRMCEKTRQKCNQLTDAQRERLLERGMQLIYGGDKTRARNSGRH